MVADQKVAGSIPAGRTTFFPCRVDGVDILDESDLLLRRETYRLFVELGRGPRPAEAAASLGLLEPQIIGCWRRLHDEHALVLNPVTDEIRMANPFSAVPTAYRVQADDRWWYANCAWDAFGILAALHCDGQVETSCPDCAEPFSITVRDRRPVEDSLVFHCLVPASQWWNDIVFT